MLPLLLVAPRLARTLVPSGVELVLPRALLLHALLAARGRTGGGIYELLWVGRVNPTTAISYTLGESGHVTLTVFDVVGRQVAQLVDGVQPSGTYNVNWNALDVTSGVYLYRLQTSVGQRTRSMVLLK